MPHDQFIAHGTVNATYDFAEKILYINLAGPFNIEFMKTYEAEIAPLRASINTPCWASMVNVFGLALAPMDALEHARYSVEQAIASGLTATAIVFHDKEASSTQQQFWTLMYSETPINFKFFQNQEDAKHWLQTEIDKCFGNLAQKDSKLSRNMPPTQH